MFNNKPLRIILIIVAIAGIWGYFSGLSVDVTRDAGKYATVAKEIYQHGNFINLTIHGQPYDQKPPLLFWLGALGFAVGGISNFWFKLPVLLVVFAGIYWGYRLGRSLYNRRVGFLTAAMLAFSVIYALYCMDIHTDTLLQAFITLALWQFSEFVKTKKTSRLVFGFTGVGLAMLSKGPVGAAIPAFAVVGHLLLKKDFKSLSDYRWYLGILLALVIVSPALIGLMNQFGWNGLKFFFWENNVGRITGSYVKATNDPIYYIHTLVYLFLPWSLLFFISAFKEIASLIKNKFRNPEYFTFTGIWIYFIILNSASSQLPNYVFPIVPLIAVLTAKWIDISLRQKAKLLQIFSLTQRFVVAVLWAGLFFIVFYLFPNPEWYLWLLIFAGIGASYYIFRTAEEPVFRLMIPSVVVLVCFAVVANMHVVPHMFGLQAPPKAARYYTEFAKENEKLYNYNYPQYELFFYSEPQAIQLYSSDEMKTVAGKRGNWIFTDAEGYSEIEQLNLAPDFVMEYQHLYLNRAGRFFNPGTRDKVLQPMYLIKY